MLTEARGLDSLEELQAVVSYNVGAAANVLPRQSVLLPTVRLKSTQASISGSLLLGMLE